MKLTYKLLLGCCFAISLFDSASVAQNTNAEYFKSLQRKASSKFETKDLPAPDILLLATNPAVRKEIELVKEQVAKIKKIDAKFSKEMTEGLKEFNSRLPKGEEKFNGFSPEFSADLQEFLGNLTNEKRKQMESVLLPHQIGRLREMALQIHINRSGEVAALSNPEIAEVLEISPDQMKGLKKRAAEIKIELDEEIAEAKAKAKEKLLSELSKKQRVKLRKLMGDKMELDEPEEDPKAKSRIRFKRNR